MIVGRACCQADPSPTGRRADETLHAYLRMSESVVVERVILVALPAAGLGAVQTEEENIAHRENYGRLTR